MGRTHPCGQVSWAPWEQQEDLRGCGAADGVWSAPVNPSLQLSRAGKGTSFLRSDPPPCPLTQEHLGVKRFCAFSQAALEELPQKEPTNQFIFLLWNSHRNSPVGNLELGCWGAGAADGRATCKLCLTVCALASISLHPSGVFYVILLLHDHQSMSGGLVPSPRTVGSWSPVTLPWPAAVAALAISEHILASQRKRGCFWQYLVTFCELSTWVFTFTWWLGWITMQNNQILSHAGDLYQTDRQLHSTVAGNWTIFLLYFYILFNCQKSRSEDLKLILASWRPFWANYLFAGARSQWHRESMATYIQEKRKKKKP